MLQNLLQVVVRTGEGKALSCFLPGEERYWLENGRFDLKCVFHG